MVSRLSCGTWGTLGFADSFGDTCEVIDLLIGSAGTFDCFSENRGLNRGISGRSRISGDVLMSGADFLPGASDMVVGFSVSVPGCVVGFSVSGLVRVSLF